RVAAQEPEGLREVLVPIAAAHSIPDLRLVVPSAGVHQGPELLCIARRTAGGFARQSVRFPRESLDLLDSAPAFQHVRDERGDDALLLAPVEVRPASPVVLDLQVDSLLEEKRDACFLVPAEARDPWVRRVLEHLVRGPGLSSKETEIDLGLEDAGRDPIGEDGAIVAREPTELLLLAVG